MQVGETFIPVVTGLSVAGVKACPHSGWQIGPRSGTEKGQREPCRRRGGLPDKTMFASLVMATRGRPFAVWLGAAAAFAVHVVIATTVGVLLIDILPHGAVELAVALTFFAGAGFALYDGLRGGDDREQADPGAAAMRRWRSAMTTFMMVFLAEWGDLTQVLTVNLAARYHSPWSVGTGG